MPKSERLERLAGRLKEVSREVATPERRSAAREELLKVGRMGAEAGLNAAERLQKAARDIRQASEPGGSSAAGESSEATKPASSPEASSPEASSPEASSPEASSPEVSSPEVSSPEADEAPKSAASTTSGGEDQAARPQADAGQTEGRTRTQPLKDPPSSWAHGLARNLRQHASQLNARVQHWKDESDRLRQAEALGQTALERRILAWVEREELRGGTPKVTGLLDAIDGEAEVHRAMWALIERRALRLDPTGRLQVAC